MRLSQSAAVFLQRAGYRPTRRHPIARMRTDSKSFSYPLRAPDPLPSLSLIENGFPAPDRVITLMWPHGD